jgi:hypothetical protein
MWQCSSCTIENTKGGVKCEGCDKPRAEVEVNFNCSKHTTTMSILVIIPFHE